MYDSPEHYDVHEEVEEIERIKQSYTKSIVPNLLHRELTGQALHRINPFGEAGRPDRLRWPIEHIIPRWAMEAGNIFMGFTQCGRYLLSYTVRSTESDFGQFLYSDRDADDWTFEYKLHFWLFKPNTHVRNVSSVLLFDNYGICHDNLLIEISQWQDDRNRLLVTGRSVNPALPHNSQQFVTITMIPEVTNCPDCPYGLPDEFVDDTFGGRTRTRTNCLRHGLTIHLAHEQVQPFPRFDPNVMLRFKDSVVINTGNLFHIFTVKLLEPEQTSPFRQELLTLPPHAIIQNSPQPPDTRSGKKRHHRHLRCDFWFKNCKNNSISLEGNRLLNSQDIFLTEEAESENIRKIHAQELIAAVLPEIWAQRPPPVSFLPPSPRKRERRHSQSSMDSEISSTTTTSEKSSRGSPAPEVFLNRYVKPLKTKMPPPTADTRKFFKRSWRSAGAVTPTAGAVTAPKSPASAAALSAYDIQGVEETLTDRNFSSFRKRRLADKKYEFKDKDADLELSENIIPLKLSRKIVTPADRDHSPVRVTVTTVPKNENVGECLNIILPRSPRGISPAMSMSMSPGQGEILRSITNTNTCVSPLRSPQGGGGGGPERKRTSQSQTTGGFQIQQSKNARPNFTTTLNCIAKVLRCYADEDDGFLSVKTDTDDEYKQTLPFPVALQLKVHGTAYRPMSVISNSRSRSCPTPVVEVLQRTLDIEVLCNEVCGVICLGADKYYSSCFDYDVAIVDVCQDRGSITAVAYVQLTAMSHRLQHDKYTSRSPHSRDQSPIPGLLDQKQKYEAMFSFIWEPTEERCRVLYTGTLKELHTVPKQWHPTKRLVPSLRSRLYDTPLASKPIKTLRNDMAVKDWQSLDELTDFQGIITLYRDRKLKRRKALGYYPSPALSSASSSQGDAGSATTSDDDEETDDPEPDSWLY